MGPVADTYRRYAMTLIKGKCHVMGIDGIQCRIIERTHKVCLNRSAVWVQKRQAPFLFLSGLQMVAERVPAYLKPAGRKFAVKAKAFPVKASLMVKRHLKTGTIGIFFLIRKDKKARLILQAHKRIQPHSIL